MLSPLTLLTTFLTIVLADVKFTAPVAGAVIPAGSLQIKWTESGDLPAITKFISYQLFLCAGGNDDGTIIQLFPITTQGVFANGNQAIGTISPGLGASQPNNAYFLKMISVLATGGTVTNFSPRFTLTGMTGIFPPAIVSGLATVGGGVAGPPRQVATVLPAAAAGPNGLYGIPFHEQTGPIIYAPMQTYPGTKITKTKMTPLNPPSKVVIAKSPMKPNTFIQKTVTQAKTWSFSQRANPETPAANPMDDMQKYLNRWKD
ncbi:hypothetical protein BT63DRAFT_147000 [Microthyrium microscopicum]|uniref:Uncharacterized protein n=1 Tax=Microthyrium microscopicum TaxID=703497 RepID=A0A6A6ULL6_9PEZI|nr:hypothetical protein BT63DRAFT_147000 [Microthyrium microscopicum]